MFNNRIQANLINHGLSFQEIALLYYFTTTFCKDCNCVNIIVEMPMYFKDAADIKKSLENLSKIDFMSFQYNRGKISQVSINNGLISSIIEFDKAIKIERKSTKSKTENIATEAMKEIRDWYSSFDGLPKPCNLTKNNIEILEKKLSNLSVEDIKEAIEYAANQEWLVSYSEKSWCNFTWVIDRIDDFMVGGKYRRYNEVKEKPKQELFSLPEEKDNIIF